MTTKPATVSLQTLLALGIPEKHAKRAIKDGLTEEDMMWNSRLNRPPHFIETQEPKVEVERRKEWLLLHGHP